jgi:2-desacetyl-2-hydroxyethyl bacteriochlorophyllide A dehydrogenase
MKQVWITRKGGPEVLMVKEGPDPSPKESEILIEVKASGINFADILARTGRYPDAPPLPMVPGYEVSGLVCKVGEKVSQEWIGKRVFAPTFFGGYSSKICVPQEQVFLLPKSFSFSQGAAISVNYLTAYAIALKLAHLKKGDTALIFSAGGGVGLALYDFCKMVGATPVGVASEAKHPKLRDHGFKFLVDPKSTGFENQLRKISEGRGFDVIFDSHGGSSWSMGLGLLSPLGRLIAFGAFNYFDELKSGKPWRSDIDQGKWYPVDIFDLTQENNLVGGFNLATLWKRSFHPLQVWLNEILNLIEAGHLNPTLDREFNFEQAGLAHHYLENRQNFGKAVLVFP